MNDAITTTGPASKLAALTDDKRAELKRQLDAIDDSIATLEKQREPWDKAINALLSIREEIVDSATGAEIEGHCEGCSRLLFYGELGHRCEDGPTLCESCAPTWSDLRRQYDASKAAGDFADGFDSPEDAETADKAVDARIAADDGDKPHVWEL